LTAAGLVNTIPGSSDVSAAALGGGWAQHGPVRRRWSFGKLGLAVPRQSRKCGQTIFEQNSLGQRVAETNSLSSGLGRQPHAEGHFAAQFRRITAERERTCRLAVAHAMPVTIYAMSEKQQTYHEIGADYFAPASRGWADMTPQVQRLNLDQVALILGVKRRLGSVNIE